MTAPFGLGAPANTTQDAKDDWFLRSLRRLENLQRAPMLFGNLDLNTKLIFDSFTTPLTYGIRTDFTGTFAHIFDWGSYSGGNMTLQTSVNGSPSLNFYSSLAVPVVNQFLGGVYYFAQNSSNVWTEYANITGYILSPTAGATGSQLLFQIGNSQPGQFPNLNALTLGTTDAPTGIFAHVFDLSPVDGANLVLQNSNAGAIGPGLMFYANSASPAVNDTAAQIRFYGRNSANAIVRYGAIFINELNVTSGAEAGQMQFKTMVAGAATAQCMALAQGMIVGAAPTGGDLGAGKINVSGGVFLNNAAYTNPDYALEHYFTGRIERFAKNIGAADYKGITPLDEIEGVLRDSCRLPGIHGEPMDIFARSDIVLEKLEEAYLYIVQLHKRVAELEARLQ